MALELWQAGSLPMSVLLTLVALVEVSLVVGVGGSIRTQPDALGRGPVNNLSHNIYTTRSA